MIPELLLEEILLGEKDERDYYEKYGTQLPIITIESDIFLSILFAPKTGPAGGGQKTYDSIKTFYHLLPR